MNGNKEKTENKDTVVKDVSNDIIILIDRRNARVLLNYLERITMGQLATEQEETAGVLHKIMHSLRFDLRSNK